MDWIVNGISLLTNNLSRFFSMCKTFFQSVIDFIGNLGSILSTLWFGVKTLLNGIWSLIIWVFDGSLFTYLYDGFVDLSGYVGIGGAIFISSILFVIMIRIIIAFVFKMFRLNIDYKTMKSKWN